MNIQVKKFSEIIELKRGFDLPSDKRQSGHFPLFSSSGVVDFVSEGLVKGPGVITGRSGSIGGVYYSKEDYWPLNTTLYVKDFKGNDPKYIYYWLSTLPLANFASGSAVPTLNRNFLSDLECKVHSIDDQRHIVGTIGTIDDLIEKAQKITIVFNDYLHKEFCSYKANAYRTECLGDFISRCGKLMKNCEWREAKVVDLSSMPNSNICIYASSKGSDFSTNVRTLDPNALLYGSIRPYFRKAGFAIGSEYVTGTVHQFLVKEGYYFWVLALISSDEFHEYTNINSQGTKMPIINFDTMCQYRVPIISETLLADFNEQIKPIFLQVKNYMQEIVKLQEIKGLLLAKYF